MPDNRRETYEKAWYYFDFGDTFRIDLFDRGSLGADKEEAGNS